MKTTLLTLLAFLFAPLILAQTYVPLKELGILNATIQEPSGLALHYNAGNGHFEYWVNNDYGNTDSIFSFHADDLLTIQRIMDLNVGWIDWEDMTKDDNGNIYIGDFGNYNGPNALQIVKIPDPNTYAGSPPSVEIIEFDYPPLVYADTEAMLHFDGYIYVFTKSINVNLNPAYEEGYTYCFRFPDVPHPMGGKYDAEFMGSHKTMMPSDTIPDIYRITGADISPDKKKVALISNVRIWIFSCFDDNNFFGGTASHFVTDFRQYEGVTFINNHELMISKEGHISNPNYYPKLFYIDVFPWIDGACMDCDKVRNGDFSIEDDGWSKFLYGAADATLTTSGGQAEIDIHTLGTSLWHINIRHKSLVLETGKTYKLRYKAHADDNRAISIIASDKSGSSYAYFPQNITTTPTYYEHEFTMIEGSDYNSYLSFNVGNYVAHRVYFDDISLREIACSCPNNRYFFADIDDAVHQEVNQNIYGSNKINANNVIYDAGNSIDLRPGFETEQGIIFKAYIDGCGGN